MPGHRQIDPFLEKWLGRYDGWLQQGEISHSSRVVPIAESFDARQWVQPTEQALQILRDQKSIAVQPCACRTHYSRCDHPVQVCLMFNAVADRLVANGAARSVDLAQAQALLQKANTSGLVHLAIYMPDHEMYGLCSCCPCCCHDLQLVKHYGRSDLMARSDYVVVMDATNCIQCGECADRCAFGARRFEESQLIVDDDACFGCGLCVPQCPQDVLSMELRKTQDPGKGASS